MRTKQVTILPFTQNIGHCQLFSSWSYFKGNLGFYISSPVVTFVTCKPILYTFFNLIHYDI